MPIPTPKKNKINLEDYDYKRDIKNRLLMSQFSVFDVDVLDEILYNSLKIPLSQLAEEMDVAVDKLMSSLEKLQKIGLLDIKDDVIVVNKQNRKYFEYQRQKFDDDFSVNLEFVRKQILSKVPIHVLPIWYNIPRSSDDIFHSIVERFLQTPKIYNRYLKSLDFEDKVLTAIMEDVFSAPDFKVRSKDLREKYGLTREEFEKKMLLLEFHFVCYLSYTQVDGEWKEVVTPLNVWHQHLRFLRDNHPQTIVEKVEPKGEHEFGFLMEMNDLLKRICQSPQPAPKDCSVVSQLKLLQLVEEKDELLYPSSAASQWLEQSLQEQAMTIYRHPRNLRIIAGSFTQRDVLQAEKLVRPAIHCGWVFLEDLIRYGLVGIGEAKGTHLEKIGRRWKYVRPVYSDEIRNLIQRTLLTRLYQTGMVMVGTCEGKPCLKVTSFGKKILT